MIHRSVTIRLRPAVLLGLLLSFGLLAAACTDDPETAAGGDGGDTTQTVQTLADAAPAEAEEPVDGDTAMLAPGLALDPGGLTIVDPDAAATELLAFGDDQAAVLAGMEAVLGSADELNEGTSECPNGQAAVATWTDTVTVDFDADGGFLSWSLRPGSELTTPDDVGLGSPVTALGDVEFFADSTLGDEFEANGYRGLATGTGSDATIDDLWAGEICAFR